MKRFFFSFLVGLGCCTSHQTPKTQTKSETQTNSSEKKTLGPFGLEGKGELFVSIHTSEGDLKCKLFEERAPISVRNFVELGLGKKPWQDPKTKLRVEGRPFYQNIPFHRIVPGFFLQTGDPLGNGLGGPGYVFNDEIHPQLKHDKAGVLSMANHGPNTNGSQFFILLKATPHLDGHHSIFGQCEETEVLAKLASHPLDSKNSPINPPILEYLVFYRD